VRRRRGSRSRQDVWQSARWARPTGAQSNGAQSHHDAVGCGGACEDLHVVLVLKPLLDGCTGHVDTFLLALWRSSRRGRCFPPPEPPERARRRAKGRHRAAVLAYGRSVSPDRGCTVKHWRLHLLGVPRRRVFPSSDWCPALVHSRCDPRSVHRRAVLCLDSMPCQSSIAFTSIAHVAPVPAAIVRRRVQTYSACAQPDACRLLMTPPAHWDRLGRPPGHVLQLLLPLSPVNCYGRGMAARVARISSSPRRRPPARSCLVVTPRSR